MPDKSKTPSLAAPPPTRAAVPYNTITANSCRGLITQPPALHHTAGYTIARLLDHDCFEQDRKAAINHLFRNLLLKYNAGRDSENVAKLEAIIADGVIAWLTQASAKWYFDRITTDSDPTLG